MNKLPEEKVELILECITKLGALTPSILEKDIFVTQAIHAISEINHPEINITFCGGTCLSKAYQLISRMSEDIDFKIFPNINFTSISAQRKKLHDFHDEITFSLKKAGFEIGSNTIRSRDNNSYRVYNLDYSSHFDKHQELKPHIQLEFTLAPPRLPTTQQSISSIVNHVFPENEQNKKSISCISILETAAEKWVGITRRAAAIERNIDPIDGTLVRHLYDLHTILSNAKLKKEFFELIQDTIGRDQIKFKRHKEYLSEPKKEIKYSLEILNNDLAWQQYYDSFISSMVFDPAPPSFKECMGSLKKVSKEILSIIKI